MVFLPIERIEGGDVFLKAGVLFEMHFPKM